MTANQKPDKHYDLIDEHATLLAEFRWEQLLHRLIRTASGELRIDYLNTHGILTGSWAIGDTTPEAKLLLEVCGELLNQLAQPSPLTPRADELRLCYIRDNFAYFTTLPVTEQWGDDWDDAPYECNAGMPRAYRDGEKNHDDGEPKVPWTIICVAFVGDFLTPAGLAGTLNSMYSVEKINAGLVPWLTQWERSSMLPAIRLFAGATLTEFVDFITSSGGEVYMTKEDWTR